MNDEVADSAGWDGVAGWGKGIIVGEPWEITAGERGWQLELAEDRPEEDGTVLLTGWDVSKEETERANAAVDDEEVDDEDDDDEDGLDEAFSLLSSLRCWGEDFSGRVRLVSESFPLGLL